MNPNDIMDIVSESLIFVLSLILFISCLWQLFSGKILLGTLKLIFLFFSCIGMLIITGILLRLNQEKDHFAENLTIPDNIEFKKPIEMDFQTGRPDSLLNLESDTLQFHLYQSFQPGLYEYDVWINSELGGTVYLKAYEITQNHRLSEESITERSRISIKKTKGQYKRFGTDRYFTIYEGDFGEPYGSRIEVWYESEMGDEKLILQENYIIEGWMN